MPRKGSDPIGVRQFIVATPGSKFLDFDFSQIELRVGAFYCRDEKMMATYRRGGDIHAQTTHGSRHQQKKTMNSSAAATIQHSVWITSVV